MKSNNDLKKLFVETRKNNPDMSLDEVLYSVYEQVKPDGESFDTYRTLILKANDIDEIEYYTRDVNDKLKL